MNLDALVAAPDDDELRLVIADALQQQGDPRGELIAVQHELRTRPTQALQLREHRLLGQLGPLEREGLKLTWHLGFLRTVEFGVSSLETPIEPELEVLDEVLGSPSALLVETLRFLRVDFAPWIVRLAEHGVRPTLRTLEVGPLVRAEDGSVDSQYDGLAYVPLGNVGVLWPLLPNLRELMLVGGSAAFGTELALPELRRFEARTSAISRGDLAMLSRAHWPRLEHVHVHIGRDSEVTRDYVDDADIGAFLASFSDGRLRHLGLEGASSIAALCAVLQTQPRTLRNLRTLDLTSYERQRWATVDLSGLIDLAPRMPELRTLNVFGSYPITVARELVQLAFANCTIHG